MFKKLSKLIASILSTPTATSGRKHRQHHRVAPTVEALEGRWVPATLQVPGLATPSAETVIREAVVVEGGKVSMQDFHFTIKMDKASPKLIAASAEAAVAEAVIGEAGKVSMQDFHFVIKQDKASPKLVAETVEAGIATPSLGDFDRTLPSSGNDVLKGKPKGDDHIKITLTDVLVSS